MKRCRRPPTPSGSSIRSRRPSRRSPGTRLHPRRPASGDDCGVSFLPLAGVRVLDLTSSLAGPTCTEILAALGADVVKIEQQGRGDEARDWGPRFFEGGSVMFFTANAGKRSVGLDLKSAAGL